MSRLALALVLTLLGLATPARGANAPAHVKVGLYATNIPEIDIKAGTFTIDMYMWMVHDGDDPALEEFEFANGEVLSKVQLERTVKDGRVYVCWRVKALLHEHFSLADYPFDRQALEVQFEHSALERDALVFEPDVASYQRSGVARESWGLKPGLEVPEYEFTGTSWRVEDSLYATDFGNAFNQKTQSIYSRAIFEIAVARSFWPYCYKILVPLLVILAIAYLVFFLPPEEIQSASALAMTALLSCVAMNLTVASNLPEVGYLVASDKFFICTYGLIFVTLVETVWTFGLSRAGAVEKAARVERFFRWAFPVGVASGFVLLMAAAAG